jgi:hypothetical protein
MSDGASSDADAQSGPGLRRGAGQRDHSQRLEHLHPLVEAVDQAEQRQPAQGMLQARIGTVPHLQQDRQAHAEERESIREVDERQAGAPHRSASKGV